MKPIHINSFANSYRSLSTDFIILTEKYGITLKTNEINSLISFVTEFENEFSILNFDDFFLSYTIKQIGKEFDLLRIGENNVLNIELKSTLNETDIKEQMNLNNYYLKQLNKEIIMFTYVESERKFYKYEEQTDQLSIIGFDLVKNMIENNLGPYYHPDNHFIPSKFLISPFNSVELFINENYFLTQHQKAIFNDIIESQNGSIFAVKGSAGTGKTLLIYSIAHHFIKKGLKVLIINGGYLNEGHIKLIEKGFHIISFNKLNEEILLDFDILVVDESQRFKKSQIDILCNCPGKTKVLSMDKFQVMSEWEENADIDNYINKYVSSSNIKKLTNKIRTNEVIAEFINGLINQNYKPKINDYSEYISYTYFTDLSSTLQYANKLKSERWIVINPTNSMYSHEFHDRYLVSGSPNSHRVIGQEFDKVAVIIPMAYKYNVDGRLQFNLKSYYKAEKMFYQAITRSKDKLHLIIYNNIEILTRIIKM